MKLPMQVVEDTGFVDPLGANSATGGFTGLLSRAPGSSSSSRAAQRLRKGPASDEHAQAVAAEWDSYKSFVMQRFASTGTITVTTVLLLLSILLNSDETFIERKRNQEAQLQELLDSNR